MKTNKRFFTSILWIILGAVLLLCSFLSLLDEFWRGMGTALLIVGILQLVRQIRYKCVEEYRDAVDTEVNDERNKFLSMKAWSWAGYIFVMIAAVCTIVLKVFGYEDYMMITNASVCVIILLYWLSYLILRKKY